MAQLVERDLAKVEAVGSNPTIRSNRRAPFDPGLVHRESDAHRTQSGHRVPPPIRRFGLPEASAARDRPKGSHLLEIRRRGSLVEQRIVYPPHESSILFVGARHLSSIG
jgi:hypothetical protein